MIFHLLTLLFIGLKLAGFIAWSWWLVLAPTLIAVVLVIAAFTFAAFAVSKVSKTIDVDLWNFK